MVLLHGWLCVFTLNIAATRDCVDCYLVVCDFGLIAVGVDLLEFVCLLEWFVGLVDLFVVLLG